MQLDHFMNWYFLFREFQMSLCFKGIIKLDIGTLSQWFFSIHINIIVYDTSFLTYISFYLIKVLLIRHCQHVPIKLRPTFLNPGCVSSFLQKCVVLLPPSMLLIHFRCKVNQFEIRYISRVFDCLDANS